MIYPSIIMLVMVAVGGIIITLVLPSLNLFFETLNVDIPIYTRIMLYAGNFLSQRWYLLIIVPLAAVFLGYLLLRTNRGKIMLDSFLLKVPSIAPIIKKSNSAFFIRSLSSLSVSTTHALQCIPLTWNV